MKPVALIIDDEVQIRRLLRVALEAENYKVHEAENGQQGLIEIAYYKPAVILLDLGLPDFEGLEVLKRLREWSEAPVVVLTVRDDVQEKVAALDAGADDYVTKPFSTPELLARLRAAQRKTRPEEEVSIFKNGDLVVDLAARVVARAGREIKLTATGTPCFGCLSGTLGASSRTDISCAKSGARNRRTIGSICAFTSHICAKRSRAIQRNLRSSRPRPESATDLWDSDSRCLGLRCSCRCQKKQLASEQVRNGESHPISEWRSW